MATSNNNTFETATDLGVLGRSVLSPDSVGPMDRIGFFRVRASGRTNFRSVVQGLSSDVKYVLFNGDRQRIAGSNQSGNQSEAINGILDRGVYFLRVSRVGDGETRFRLRVAGTPATAPNPATAKFVGLTQTNSLAFFNSNRLNNVRQVAVTGLQSGESLLGIDFRPNTGQLFGVGSSNRLYAIDSTTGQATQVGTGNFAVSLNGSSFGVDFNPTVDRIRVVSNAGQNLRLNPDTGAVVDANMMAGDGIQIDKALNGGTTSVNATAYTNSVRGAISTTQYTIDSTTDRLFIQNPPNDGTQTPVGSLGVDLAPNLGFDIVTTGSTNTAFALSGNSLYGVNLSTGAASRIGSVGDRLNQTDALTFVGLAARP